jgi:hypothetical protein
MNKKALILTLLTMLASVQGSAGEYTAEKLYKMGMAEYYVFYKTLSAARLFNAGIRQNETYLNNYMGLFRYYVRHNNNLYAKRVLDRAYDDCRSKANRINLITAKARFIYDELSNKAKGRAFVKWAGEKYSFRRLDILKARFSVQPNKILRLANIKTAAKRMILNWKRYKNKKVCLIFYHPGGANIKSILYKSYSVARRYGFIPLVFCVISKNQALKYSSSRLNLRVIYKNKYSDISRLAGIDLVPHAYFLGRDKEVLYSGHPLHIEYSLLNKIGRY